MVRHGAITPAEAAAALAEPLVYKTQEEALPLRAPWFVEYVKQELIARFGEECFQTCGLTVVTTLDIGLQDQAQQIVNNNLATYGERVGVYNGSLLSIDARTGEILVMLGSRDYYNEDPAIQGSNNFATAILQPGSSFKPFVYLSLFLEHGYGPSSIIWGSEFTTSDGYKCEDPRSVGRVQGPLPVKIALGSSLNCAANRAAATAGVQKVIETAQTMGITTLDDPSLYGPSIATGGANINLLDMAFGYVTMARNGEMIGDPVAGDTPGGERGLAPAAIRQVTNPAGEVLYKYEPRTEQVVPPGYPYLVNHILSDCQNRRLIWPCGFPMFSLSDNRPAAVKTGTQAGARTIDTVANWQFMYTPQLVTGGWVGNADRTSWTDVNGGANAVGHSVQQLHQLITNAYEIPAADFQRPPEVVSVPVRVPDATRNTLFGCGPTEQGLFVDDRKPDPNNRICVNGVIRVPPEQLGTGGLRQWVPVAPPTPSPTASPTPGASPTPDRPDATPRAESTPDQQNQDNNQNQTNQNNRGNNPLDRGNNDDDDN
jgi:membrane peptidoglycan carboxypeptidase